MNNPVYSGTSSIVLPERVREELKRVMESKTFQRAYRLRNLLEYVVDATMQGHGGGQRRTARELYGKGDDDFDPTLDPVIRVQFGRLRRALASYYAREGKNDPIIIEIPNRRYTAVFHDPYGGQHVESMLGSKGLASF